MSKTVYLNLDDDVAKIAAKAQQEKSADLVLVFPKKSFIFSDSINLRLLKKQLDLLGKTASIMTMDEKGQMYAKEAGFDIKHLTRTNRTGTTSDIRQRPPMLRRVAPQPQPEVHDTPQAVAPVPTRTRVRTMVRKTRVQAPVITSGPTPRTRVEKNDNFFLPPDSPTIAVPARRSYRRWVISFIAISLVVILLLVLVVLPSATVTVYAKSQTVARDIDVIADVNAQQVDADKLTIPAYAVNENQSPTNSFQTLGKQEVGSKAEGRVAIYNLTGSPLNLKASTTTLNVGSKSYVFKADENGIKALPSANQDQNATVADIIATAGGEDFNLPSGTRLEITNQAFGSQPTRLYAKTVTQVVGGSSRFISVITKDDLTKAQQSLTDGVISDINNKLKAQSELLVDGAYTANVTNFTSDKPEGTQEPTFNASEQVAVTGLAINESSLKDMVRQRFIEALGTSKSLQEASADTITYKVKNIDTANGLMQLSLHYESKAIPALEVKSLQSQIAGKKKSEAAELILANPDVDHVEISLAPVWQTSLPRFNSKIHLEIKQ